jgi:hypothetical protein
MDIPTEAANDAMDAIEDERMLLLLLLINLMELDRMEMS